jgi:hypothetical protein
MTNIKIANDYILYKKDGNSILMLLHFSPTQSLVIHKWRKCLVTYKNVQWRELTA